MRTRNVAVLIAFAILTFCGVQLYTLFADTTLADMITAIQEGAAQEYMFVSAGALVILAVMAWEPRTRVIKKPEQFDTSELEDFTRKLVPRIEVLEGETAKGKALKETLGSLEKRLATLNNLEAGHPATFRQLDGLWSTLRKEAARVGYDKDGEDLLVQVATIGKSIENSTRRLAAFEQMIGRTPQLLTAVEALKTRLEALNGSETAGLVANLTAAHKLLDEIEDEDGDGLLAELEKGDPQYEDTIVEQVQGVETQLDRFGRRLANIEQTTVRIPELRTRVDVLKTRLDALGDSDSEGLLAQLQEMNEILDEIEDGDGNGILPELEAGDSDHEDEGDLEDQVGAVEERIDDYSTRFEVLEKTKERLARLSSKFAALGKPPTKDATPPNGAGTKQP